MFHPQYLSHSKTFVPQILITSKHHAGGHTYANKYTRFFRKGDNYFYLNHNWQVSKDAVVGFIRGAKNVHSFGTFLLGWLSHYIQSEQHPQVHHAHQHHPHHDIFMSCSIGRAGIGRPRVQYSLHFLLSNHHHHTDIYHIT